MNKIVILKRNKSFSNCLKYFRFIYCIILKLINFYNKNDPINNPISKTTQRMCKVYKFCKYSHNELSYELLFAAEKSEHFLDSRTAIFHIFHTKQLLEWIFPTSSSWNSNFFEYLVVHFPRERKKVRNT